jgi:hypothetical protein
MAKTTQSQTVIVNVKQEKEKKPKRKRRSTKKGTKASPRGVSQGNAPSQNQSVQPIYRGISEPGIQQRFLAPDPQTTRVLNDLSSALQTFRQQSIPQPPPPSTAVIVSPPVGAMPTTPIARAPRPAPRPTITAPPPAQQQSMMPIRRVRTSTQSDRDVESTFRNVEELYSNLPRNPSGTIRRRGREWTSLTEEQRRNVIGYESMQGTTRRNARAPAPEPEPSMTTLSEPARMPAPAPMTNLRTTTPSRRVAMLVDNTAAQLYSTSKLGQPQVQQNDIDDALQEID